LDGNPWSIRRILFETLKDEWQTLRLPFEEFLPAFRGRFVREALHLDLSCVTSLGLMVSDRQAGPFRLEIARIGAYVD